MKTTPAIFTFILLATTAPHASTNSVPDAHLKPDESSALLVIRVGTGLEEMKRNRQFLACLELAMDGVRVLSVDPDLEDFEDQPLASQIGSVRRLLEKHNGLAATWLSEASPRLVLLNMVVLSSGRALVRLVEGNPRQPGYTTDLAMAARELLGTAFLFHEVPASQDKLSHVVEAVRSQAAAPPTKRISPWSISAKATLLGGMVGQLGPSLAAGGTLTVERRIKRGLRGRVFFGAYGGPWGQKIDYEISSMSMAPGTGLCYLWKAGPLFLGPALNIHATWTSIWIRGETIVPQHASFWSVAADIGPELHIPLGGKTFLVAGASISATPLKQTLTLRSTGELFFSTPYLSWQASLSFVLAI